MKACHRKNNCSAGKGLDAVAQHQLQEPFRTRRGEKEDDTPSPKI